MYRDMSVGEEYEGADERAGVVSPELEKWLAQLSVSSVDHLPHQITSLTFSDDEGREWRIDPSWSVSSESGFGRYCVWSQLEITLQPAGGVS